MIMSIKQREIKIELRTKLNRNIHHTVQSTMEKLGYKIIVHQKM